MTRQWINAQGAADLCGISRWTWHRYVTRGEAPAPISHVPGRPKWKRREVEQFADGLFRADGRRIYFVTMRQRHHERAMQARSREPRDLARVGSR
jgi:predicted DNA-binding transcriptional regulator AlpA